MQNVYLFMTIIKKSDSEEFIDFYLKHDAAPIYSTICQGSANSKTLDLLGLEKSEKIMMQSLVPHNKLAELKNDLTRNMSIDLPDRGIALAIPLSSIASRRVLNHIVKDENEENIQKETSERSIEMELVVSICAKGHSDEIMNAAREAGARGGTIVKAKGTASAGTDKFFGMAISDEKEITYIVTKKDQKSTIMKAIASYTYADGAHPIVFSLPVTETAGFRLLD
ncbi:MAG: P-II family nitrogen regulator [Ruminococcaceae bacterium]|nr:P-II family nitrogen regulator [Oscillospiraceae bacterium]